MKVTYLNTLKNHLEHREKAELIAIIQHMLLQEPDLQWLLATPLPTASFLKASIDPKIYQQQIMAAMSAGDYQRKRKRGEVQQRFAAIKSIADGFAANENYAEALTIYEVLVNEIIAHFNDYRDEYVAFSVILMGCIDGLIAALQAKRTIRRCGYESFERSLPSTASIRIAEWTWMKTFLVCLLATPRQRNDRLSRVGYRMRSSKKQLGATANDMRFFWQL